MCVGNSCNAIGRERVGTQTRAFELVPCDVALRCGTPDAWTGPRRCACRSSETCHRNTPVSHWDCHVDEGARYMAYPSKDKLQRRCSTQPRSRSLKPARS